MLNKLMNEELAADFVSQSTDDSNINKSNDGTRKKRICLIGTAADDPKTVAAAQTFGVPVEISETGIEKLSTIEVSENGTEKVYEREWITYFVMNDFSGPIFANLKKEIHDGRKALQIEKDIRKKVNGEIKEERGLSVDFGRILSPIALQYATKNGLQQGNHPVYNYSMKGVVACFTGFRSKDRLIRLVDQIHSMGGSVRHNVTSSNENVRVTHLICDKIPCLTKNEVKRGTFSKYLYAMTFGLPVIKPEWVKEAWEQRDVENISPIHVDFIRPYKLKAFEGYKVCFVGFVAEEHDHMIDILNSNGGIHTHIEDPECTHVIISNTAGQFSENQSSFPTTPTIPSHSPFQNIAKEVRTEDSEANNSQAPDGIVLHLNEANGFIDPNDLSPILKCKPDDVVSILTDGLENIEEENSGESENHDAFKRKRDNFDNVSIDSMAPSFSSTRKLRRRGSITQTLKRRLSFVGNPITKLRSRRNSVDPNTSLCSITSVDSVFNESIKKCAKDKSLCTLRGMIKSINKTPKSSKIFSKLKSNLIERTPDVASDSVDFKTPQIPTPSTTPFSQKIPESGDHINSGNILAVNSKSAMMPVRKPNFRSTTNEPDDAPEPNVIVDDAATLLKVEPKSSDAVIVKSDWFWYTIQNGYADESEHLFENYLDRICNASAPNRKRKLLHLTSTDSIPRGLIKVSRSSMSDVGLLSGSLLDYTASPNIKELEISIQPKKKTMRYNHFMDLFNTESNYVGILNTITKLFYDPLKKAADEGKKDALINISEIKSIFNNFSPINEVHKEMLEKFRGLQENWSEDCLIGKIILDHREALIRAYPPYVNFFEQMKEALVHCDTQHPRFHAFLKINQAKAECGRQSLQDLMIRPVQRLPSISLLISDILKHTPKTNPDFQELETALKAIKEVMTYINEDKRKTESRLALFDIFNDVDNCPPDLVSSHRRFISKCEVTELSNILSGRDDPLMLFLFTDYMEICKIKKHRINSAKSPTTALNTTRVSHQKSYKHIKLLPLSSIAVVYDIQDSPRAFALPHKEKIYSFSICDDIEKPVYLKSLCKQLAENACRADADQFLQFYESEQLGIDVSDINVGTLKKAFNYAKTRLKGTRAFSLQKTPPKMK